MDNSGNHHRGSVLVRLVISLALLAAAGWLLLNRQYAFDQFSLWTYQPSREVQALATETTMNDTGQFYFYASQPEIQDRQQFNDSCRSVQAEKTAVLGCYAAQRIYLFDIDDERLDGIQEVTAAHEMLHAAYERMDSGEQDRINDLLEELAANQDDPELETLLEQYAETQPGERLNELHSIIPTQVRNIGDELEDYYSRYFDDRRQVVNLYEDYNVVFQQLRVEQKRLVAELDALAEQINTQINAYNRQAAAFGRDAEQYQRTTYTSQSEADQDRQALLARQTALESQHQAIKRDQSIYDQKYEQLQELNTMSVSLNNSINSSLDPVQTVD